MTPETVPSELAAAPPQASTSSAKPESAIKPNGNKGKGRRPGGRREDSPDVQKSKALSYILRHGAEKEGLAMRADGFVKVDDLLKRPKCKDIDLDDLHRLVKENAKQRFRLQEEPDTTTGQPVLWIRANQGHSIEVEDLELHTITSPEECPTVVHGTYLRHWEAIRKEGLKAMTRHHIHCAAGLFGEDGVTSGMRASCNLFIYIDLPKAMADGIVFQRSANGVILTKGVNGSLASRYFARVTDKEGASFDLQGP